MNHITFLKRKTLVPALLIAILACLPLTTHAEIATVTVDQIKYQVNTTKGEATISQNDTSLEIENLVIPDNIEYNGKQYPVTSVGLSAFDGCTGLTGSITFGNAVTKINSRAFYDCSGLTGSLNIPNSVTSIGISTFAGCSGLTSVTIPGSVTSIGSSAFAGCSELTKAEFSSIESLCNIDFWDDLANPLYFAHNLYINGEEITDLVIPSSVSSICECAFNGCSGLTSVTIPNTVSTIGDRAFYGCSGLSGTLIIPSSVTSIGESAFVQCSFNKIICEAATPPVIGDSKYSAFSSNTYKTPLLVPSESIPLYKEAFDWNKFNNISAIAVEATGISLDKTEATLTVGESLTLTATVEPADEADQTVIWESSDPSVATVDESGRVTAINPGTADITAATADGSGLKATANITVKPDIPTSVDEIEASEAMRPIEIYTLDGIKVGDNLDNLTKGFYIVRQGNSAQKILISE